MKTYLLVFIMSLLCLTSGLSGQAEAERFPVFFSDGWFSIWLNKKEDIVKELSKLDTVKGLYWFSFDSTSYRITRAGKIEIEEIEIECSGAVYGIAQGGTGYMISGFDGLREGEDRCITPKKYIFPDKYEFEFNEIVYELSATGEYTGNDYYNAKNVKLYFRKCSTGEPQHLITIPELESKQPQVLFIGDIDGDGKPDFILEEGYNYELFEVVLYLSSMAEEGKLVKRAGMDGTWNDC